MLATRLFEAAYMQKHELSYNGYSTKTTQKVVKYEREPCTSLLPCQNRKPTAVDNNKEETVCGNLAVV